MPIRYIRGRKNPLVVHTNDDRFAVLELSSEGVVVLEDYLRMRIGYPASIASLYGAVKDVIHLHYTVVRMRTLSTRRIRIDIG